MNKVNDTASDVMQKIKENETVSSVVEKINQNEHVQKIKNSKYSNFIKIGAIAVALILIVCLFSAIFGNKHAKVAEEAMTKEIVTTYQNAQGYSNVNFESKLIAKNKGDDLYLFDTTLKYTRAEEQYEKKVFYIVYSDGKGGTRVRSFSYEEGERNNVKEEALAVLKKGMKKPSLPN